MSDLTSPGAFRPLSNVRVVDLSRALAGPYCTMLLADLGADVVKIEPPGGDETRGWGPPFVTVDGQRASAYFAGINRNKRSIVLDLKHPAAYEVACRLIAKADVLVENFRPGVMDELGLGSSMLLAAHPRVIWCSLTAFGQSGPWRQWKGYDLIVQALSGLMDLTGFPEGPPTKVGVAISDLAAGLHAAVAIVGALLERQMTGRGRVLDLSLLDCTLALMAMYAPAVVDGYRFSRMGNAHPQIVPYQQFDTADDPIVVAVTNDSLWRKLCTLLDLESLADQYRNNEARAQHRTKLVPQLAARFRTRTARVWLQAFTEEGIPAAPVWNLADVLAAAHVSERGMIQRLAGSALIANPITRSETPAGAPPAPGAHTLQILDEIGYGLEDVQRLLENKALGPSP
jgi:crotonobetainyl-CoA:carnitine CoA-transferase CaiB-like acyl-CoA transferase